MDDNRSAWRVAVDGLKSVLLKRQVVLVVVVAVGVLAVGKVILAISDDDDLVAPALFAAACLAGGLALTMRR